jgi:hypothetical protein
MTHVGALRDGTRRRALVFGLAGAVFAAAIRAQSSSLSSDLDPDPFAQRSIGRPTFIFYPPIPPPLDRPVVRISPTLQPRSTPPPELTAYVNEPFYPPLSVRLARRDLDDPLRARLVAYVAARAGLREELHAELARTNGTEPDARQQALEALARRQSRRLAELEQTADALREGLITGEYDWGAFREWHLGDKNIRGDSPLEIAQVMRGYAFYQKGLSPAQRRLLREIALELSMAAENTAAATAAQPFLFFPPEPARLLLPDDLPAALAAKVAAYQTKRSILKKELYDAVYAEDGRSSTFAFIRSGRFKALGERQATGFDALETLAEDIRHDLVQLPPMVRPGERSPLPPVLTARVSALVQNRLDLQNETTAKIEAIRRRGRRPEISVGVTYQFDATGLKFAVFPARQFRGGATSGTAKQVETIESEMSAIGADYGRRFAALINETDDIRRAIGENSGNSTPAAADSILGAAVRFALLQSSEDANREYRTAVFEPGLSPEQRRLLMGSAIERLELPLGRGELQPSVRAANW